MSKLILAAEFTPGTTIDDAVREALEFSSKVGIRGASFNFNGVMMFVYPGKSVEHFVEHYYAEVERRYERYDI